MTAGILEFVKFESSLLKNNPLGDPATREFPVYLPPDYQKSQRTYPVLFGLSGFTSSGPQQIQKKFLSQSMDEILDELIVHKNMPPVIYVMPDCMTKLGGSQYVNSSAVGNYEDYIVSELVPFIKGHFRTNGNFGIIGGSSGGVGAFSLAAKYPDTFKAFASHSLDCGFEYCFLSEIPLFVQAMAKYDYEVENFFNAFQTTHPQDAQFRCLLNLTAMSACYSPNQQISPHGFELPFDPWSGLVKPSIWKKWLEHDPVHMIDKYVSNLKKLKLIYIDCGTKDQFHLYLGSRQLHKKLSGHQIQHVYEEYNSDHGLLRKQQMKKSIPMLVNAL